jgi:polar amino acid transport system substrate-binding protein
MGEDGILAAPDAEMAKIQSLDDLEGRRIGVQGSSIYETWLTETMIQTGRLPAANLLTYGSPEEAIEELDSGALDLVILDRRPAENYASRGAGQLVGYGLKPQAFAIALRKGSPLLPEIDRVLREMVDDGTTSELISEYLQIPLDVELPGSRLSTPTPNTP